MCGMAPRGDDGVRWALTFWVKILDFSWASSCLRLALLTTLGYGRARRVGEDSVVGVVGLQDRKVNFGKILRMVENLKLDVPRVPGMLIECGGMVSEMGCVVEEENTSILCVTFISLF